MKITIIQVGKTKNRHIAALESDLQKRLKSDCKLEILTVKEPKLPQNSFVIALDEHGKELKSTEFAALIKENRDKSGPKQGHITFIIGGPFGLPKAILTSADLNLALSRLTFTHEMVRPILLEQIYRAFTIIKGKTYHY